jgi:hypothetical protein
MDHDALKNRFTYHAPNAEQAKKYETLRSAALAFAELINELAPESAEKTKAVGYIDQAVMHANAAIARYTN